MENMMKKWKKMMNNDKRESTNLNTNNNQNANEHVGNDFNNNLTFSTRSERRNKFNNNPGSITTQKSQISRNHSEDNMNNLIRSSSSHQTKITAPSPIVSPKVNHKKLRESIEKEKDTSNLTHSFSDKIIQILSKTINYIKKSQGDCNLLKVVDNLNDAIDLHVENLNNNKISAKKTEEKDLIFKTKIETAEKIVKDFELKYLTSEKEKVYINILFISNRQN
jgi:hypothetical protein